MQQTSPGQPATGFGTPSPVSTRSPGPAEQAKPFQLSPAEEEFSLRGPGYTAPPPRTNRFIPAARVLTLLGAIALPVLLLPALILAGVAYRKPAENAWGARAEARDILAAAGSLTVSYGLVASLFAFNLIITQ